MIKTSLNTTFTHTARTAILCFVGIYAFAMGAFADGERVSIDQSFCENASTDHVKKTIVETALTFDVEPELILAIADTESEFQIDKIGEFGAVGVMQVKPFDINAFYSGDVRSLAVTDINVSVAVRYLKQLYREYDRRWDLALAHYLAGPLKRGQDGYIVTDDAQGYVQRVFASRSDYRSDAITQCLIKFHYPDFVLAGGASIQARNQFTANPDGRRTPHIHLSERDPNLLETPLFLARSTTFPYGYDTQQIELKYRFARSLKNKRAFRKSLREGAVFRIEH